MKVSVIISACDNRYKLFEHSLHTYSKQQMRKDDFEIILVDDAKRTDLYELCKKYHKKHKINFQYIRIDPGKSFYTTKSFTPALTNNIGFRSARADIVVISGPEVLQAENNMKVASKMINRKECAYGLVYSGGKKFNEFLEKNPEWRKYNFKKLLEIPGAKVDCLTKPPHPPAYWFCMAVKKEYVEKINGIDERFLGGICGEDDDFANRMRMSGIIPIFEHRIVGIHQDHSVNDKNDNHSVRFTNNWNILRAHNLKLMYQNLKDKRKIANKYHQWGSFDVILEKEIIGRQNG